MKNTSNEGFLQSLKAGFILFMVPAVMYLLIKWDPYIGGSENGGPLGAVIILVLYWIAIYQVNKYRKRFKDRTWQLAQFLSSNWTIEEREKERIKLISNFLYMNSLKDEYPEIFSDGLLKMPSNEPTNSTDTHENKGMFYGEYLDQFRKMSHEERMFIKNLHKDGVGRHNSGYMSALEKVIKENELKQND